MLFVVSSFVSFTQKVPAALDELSLIRSGKPVVGTVTGGDLSNSEGGSSDQPMVSYRYTVHGKEHEGRYTDQQVLERALEAGSAVKLEYSSDRPSLSRPAGTGRTSVVSWFVYHVIGFGVTVIMGAVFTLVVLAPWLQRRWQEGSRPLRRGNESPASRGLKNWRASVRRH